MSESDKVVELTDQNFDELTGSGLTLVDFWAPWCGPCKALGPIIDALAESLNGQVTIGKVNVDNSQAVATKFGIRSIPAIFIMKDGAVVEQFIGLQTQEKLAATIQKHLA